jgi:hypothetical protein
MRNAVGQPLGKAVYNHVPLGAGGQVIRLSQSTAGTTKAIATDIGGAYVMGPSDTIWRQLYLSTSIPAGLQHANLLLDGNYTDSPGCPDVVVAPSDGTILYLMYDGYLLKSTDRGVTFANTGMTRFRFDINNLSAQKVFGHVIAVDNSNPSALLVGTQGNGVFASTNGGTSFASVGASSGAVIPGTDGYPVYHLTAVDPTSTQSGGIRQRWFYSRYGTGIYMSTTGPAGTYSLMAGSPTNPMSLYVDDFGTLWVTQYNVVNNVWKWTNAGGWVNVTGFPGDTFYHVAVDPANASRITFAGVNFYQTINGGTNWSAWDDLVANNPPKQIMREKSIKYLDVGPTKQYQPFPDYIEYDRTTPGRLVCSWGSGISYCDMPSSSATPLTWIGFGEGIEELLVHSICVPPGGKPQICAWDMGPMRVDSLTRYVNPQIGAHQPTDSWANKDFGPVKQQPCSAADYASDNSNWIAYMQHGGWFADPRNKPRIGYSTDGGQTVQLFPVDPPNHPASLGGGEIIVGAAGYVMVRWPGNGTPVRTKDGGYTWSDINIPGLPTGVDGGGSPVEKGFEWQGNVVIPFLNKFIATVDKTNNNVYIYNYGPTSAPSLKGIWKTTNWGDTWTQVYSGSPTVNNVWHTHLKAVPGQTGHLFWTAGLDQPDSLMRSTDGAVSWTACTTNSGQAITYVTDVGFGKAAPGKTYPAIYFWGAVNGVFGMYRSDDNLVTSILLAAKPANGLVYPTFVAGDPDLYGRHYIGLFGNGALVGSYDDTLNLAA